MRLTFLRPWWRRSRSREIFRTISSDASCVSWGSCSSSVGAEGLSLRELAQETRIPLQ